MVLSKCLRVLEKAGVKPPQPYGILLEHRNKSETLLFESQAIAILSSQETEAIRKNYIKITDAYGCLGVLQLHAGDNILLFLVLVTSCDSIGKIADCEIFRITQIRFVPLQYNDALSGQHHHHHHHQSSSNSSTTPSSQTSYEEKLNDVQSILNSGTFYFAWHQHNNAIGSSSSSGGSVAEDATKSMKSDKYSFDITLSAQRRLQTNETDNRFFWNRTLYIHLLRFGVDCKFWLLKILCGSVDIRTIYAGSRQARTAIISRLSCERAGTRFIVRGTNDDGHVANFVETEQIIYLDNEITSYIQTRGSVPLFWEQPGVQVGSHKIKFSRGYESATAAFRKHMAMMTAQYGHFCIVNLLGTNMIGSKEGEATLSNEFQRHHQESDYKTIPHIVYDYHQQCRGRNKTQALTELKREIQMYSNQYGFFHMTYNNKNNSQSGITIDDCKILKEQYGVFRVNCLDCLDRTNCVQTYFGLEALAEQIQLLGMSDKKQTQRFEDVFQEMWVSNGNEISKIYAGTGAIQGASKLMDGARSAARTIQNNLLDNSKQEGFDLLLYGSTLNVDYSDCARTLLPPNMLCTPSLMLQEMCHRSAEYEEMENIKIAIGTYNVNGGKHFRSVVYKEVSLGDWLFEAYRSIITTSDTIDFFAIGFQEIVDLNASNIMAASTDNAKQWVEELQKTLCQEEQYTLITYQQLVGVCLFVFVRSPLAQYVRDVAIDCVKTGLGGATGNKGAVAIRLTFHGTSICFVCAHFAAGQSQVNERNSDYAEITRKITFPPIAHSLLSHDYVFWCGDFNYRIDMDKEQLKELIRQEEFDQILVNDQLTVQKVNRNVFRKFHEGKIAFPPTYKYDLFSDDYDTSEKCRAPAWTDRILWKRKRPMSMQMTNVGDYHDDDDDDDDDNNEDNVLENADGTISGGWSYGKLLFYGRADLKQSDHRPVIAVISIEISKINNESQREVFNQIVQDLGPPDATIVIQSDNTNSSNTQENSIYDENVMSGLIQSLGQFGEVILVRYVDETLWITFRNSKSTLAAIRYGSINVGGVTFSISLKTDDWLKLINEEIGFCTTNTVPFYDYKKDPKMVMVNKSQPPPRPVNSPKRPPPPTRPPMPKSPTNNQRQQLPKAGIISITPDMFNKPTKTEIVADNERERSSEIVRQVDVNKEADLKLDHSDTTNSSNAQLEEDKGHRQQIENLENQNTQPPSLPPPTLPPPQLSQQQSVSQPPKIPSRPPPIPTRNETPTGGNTSVPQIPNRNDMPPIIPPRNN